MLPSTNPFSHIKMGFSESLLATVGLRGFARLSCLCLSVVTALRINPTLAFAHKSSNQGAQTSIRGLPCQISFLYLDSGRKDSLIFQGFFRQLPCLPTLTVDNPGRIAIS